MDYSMDTETGGVMGGVGVGMNIGSDSSGGAEASTGALQRGSALLAQHRLESARLNDLDRRTYRRADWQICPTTPSDACQMRHMYSFNHNSNSYVRMMRLRESLADMAHSNAGLHYRWYKARNI